MYNSSTHSSSGLARKLHRRISFSQMFRAIVVGVLPPFFGNAVASDIRSSIPIALNKFHLLLSHVYFIYLDIHILVYWRCLVNCLSSDDGRCVLTVKAQQRMKLQ